MVNSRLRLRFVLAVTVLLTGSGLAAYLLTCTALSAWVFGMGGGNVRYAERWRNRLAAFSDPDEAQAAYPEVEAKRFPNGEWVIGVSADSHSSHWGGTIVVKDSTGNIHIWFGHVCGRRRLEMSPLRDCSSLKSFYSHRDWVMYDFREVALPPASAK